MKNFFKVFIGVLAISVLFISCDKEEDNNNETIKNNYLKVGETEYSLSSGILENYGLCDDEDPDYLYDGYMFDLSLISSGVSIETDEYGDAVFSGSGQIIYFEMFASDSSELDIEYNYNDASPFSIGDFGNYCNYTVAFPQEGEDDWLKITSGKITVTTSGDEYEITIDCTDQDGNSVTGYYKGTLQYFDYDDYDDENDEDETIENSFNYDGASYPTPNLAILNAGEVEGGGTEFEIWLYSSTISFGILDEEVSITGNGDYISLWVTTASSSESLPEGDYIFDGEGNCFDDFEGGIDEDLDSDEDTGTYLEGETGEVNVTKEGDLYLIEYSLQLSDGEVLTGNYEGEVTFESEVY